MNRRNNLIAIFVMYVMLLSTTMVAANAAPLKEEPLAGSALNFSLAGEYSPRSRCRDRAKREWKRCRSRDRRRNEVCDMELARRRAECDRYR